ncbi:cupin domain-containing protein [Saliphagus infecundisoli]|uniref:Cupin domain-containing protein n=1 Tax=Saliphagus infecundisoli TaxID=1849069 RepID=A0ABD5QAV5_9EURY|nr:cupin domain-containing protein [Saliphagus infecundisoli]
MYSKIDGTTTDGTIVFDYYGDIVEEDDGRVVKPLGDEFETQQMQPMLWRFPAGAAGNMHKHEVQEEFYHVIEGELEVDIEDESLTLGAGESLYVSPEVWRKTVASEDSVVLIIGAPKAGEDGIRPDEDGK